MPPVLPLADLRVVARGLRRRPAFLLAAGFTIALGIGATTAIYSLVDAVLLRPLPFTRPNELVTLDVRGVEGNMISLSIPNYRDWRDRNRSFSSMSAAAGWSFLETGITPASVIDASIVMGPHFQTLGVDAAIGRVFLAAETEPGSEPLVVLGHGFWQRRFGGDPGVIGRGITLDARPHTIIGVLPPGRGWPSAGTEVYVNMGSVPGLPFDQRSSSFGTRAIARLAPGATLAGSADDLARVHREVTELAGEPVAEPLVRSLHDWYAGPARQPLIALLASVGLLLLIAIVNVANLQLGRGDELRRDLAVRTALGATRGALVRLRLLESLLLALVGGAAGLLIAVGAIRGLVAMIPRQAPSALTERIGLSPEVLVFSIVMTSLAGLLIGVVPALRASRVAPGEGLMGGTRAVTSGGRLIGVLVGTEIALALMLLIGSGLAMRSLINLRSADIGFAAEGVLSARMRLPSGRYTTPERYAQLQEGVLAETRSLPGVQRASLSLLVPLSRRSWELRGFAEGRTERDDAEHTLFNMVTPEYFATLGVPLLRGRGFTDDDRATAPPVVVIDEVMAARLWPGEDPLGKRLWLEEYGEAPDSVPLYREVIGVTRNLRHYAVAEASRSQAYIPVAQARRRSGAGLSVSLSTAGDPSALARPLADAIARVDPDIALSDVRPLQSYVEDDLATSRLLGWLLTVFSGVALVLAAVGIFGMIAYAVARRTKEWGVRLALGAAPQALVGRIVLRGLRLSLIGVGVGLAGAVLLSRLLGSLLYGVSAVDPLTYAGLAVALLAIAALASWLPSRRVARLDAARILTDQ